MTDVAAHQYERCRSGASEGGDVSDRMARDVKNVEAAVAEEIVGRILADLSGGVERDFVNCATSTKCQDQH